MRPHFKSAKKYYMFNELPGLKLYPGVLRSVCVMFFTLMLASCATLKSEKESKSAPPKTIIGVIKNIKVEPVDGKTRVTIESSESIQYTAFKLKNPLRLVLDLNNTDIGEIKDPIKVNNASIDSIRTQKFSKTGSTRIEILVNRQITHEIIRPDVNSLQILIPDEIDLKKLAEKRKNLPRIDDVDILKIPDGKSRVVVKTLGGMPKFTLSKKEDIKQLILEIEDALLSPKAEKEINIPDPSMIVKKVSSYRSEKGTTINVRVAIDLSDLFTYKVYRDNNNILLDIARELKPTEENAEEIIKTKKTKVIQPTVFLQEKKADVKIRDKKETKKEKSKAEIQKRMVSMDLQNAEVTNLLKMIADVSEMNIITGDAVKGKISMRLVNVPWDRALDVILKTAKLGMIRDGNIIRIAPIATIAAERKAMADEKTSAIEMMLQNEKLEELTTEIIPINYAQAADMMKNITKIKSDRGDIAIDSRTNSIIITDTAKTISKMQNLIKLLDKRTPQVLIEARIVEVNRNYSKKLGIEWGGDISKTTSNAFPSTVDLAGSSVGTKVVSLGAPAGAGTGGAIEATLGSVAGSRSLDIRLSALESQGKARILSTPKIVTSDNKEAKIESGKSIPYSTVSDSGTSVAFVNATISLNVKPHITSDGYIDMTIDATKDEADFGNQVQGTPSIITKTASTQVLIKDGETTVIGGLYKTTSSDSTAGVPWFNKIPILGWFFKNKSHTNEGDELLIFITATILK